MQSSSQDIQAVLHLAMVDEVSPQFHQVTVFAPTNDAFAALLPPFNTTIADVRLLPRHSVLNK